MTRRDLKHVAQQLTNLADTIQRIVVKGRSDGALRREPEVLRWWRVGECEYDSRGLTVGSATMEETSRPKWDQAVWSVVRALDRTGAYAAAQSSIRTVATDGQLLLLGQLVTALARIYLTNAKDVEGRAQAVVAAFVDLLRDKPHNCDVTVELKGIAILSKAFRFTACGDVVQLRAMKVKDLEIPRSHPSPQACPPVSQARGDSILRVRFRTRDARGGYQHQLKVWKALCILRLFRTGSINAISYEMRRMAKPLRLSCGTSGSRARGAHCRYSIARDDVANLKRFWKRVSPILPEVVFAPSDQQHDCVRIAYQRYCDAILDGGRWERRLATAVMGLEALFLDGGGELRYKLSLRVARVLGLLGLEPHSITSVLRRAYDVRSAYVHGSVLSKDKERKIGQEWGGSQAFMLRVFKYLRLGILVSVMTSRPKEGMLPKENLLRLVDRSMVDATEAHTLEKRLRPVREIVDN